MQLYCCSCNKFMGEVMKWNVRKHAKIMCWQCWDEVIRLREEVKATEDVAQSMAQYNKSTAQYTKIDMPDFLQNLTKDFRK